ncbi:MAG TPA: sigma-70 family RNA polymerase sigma factor [Gemmataceae bacterium]|jgi:RNA polymerase sigma factor (sigma-70 family)|nr:sigma-70 family RNA polymerase sigma factor [Gemmataceae bacterium]
MTTCAASLTDGQLLERFARQHDEEGFRQLVQRHGAMVLGVCRQVLRQEQDAEDAFQATFLVLSRKAGSIRNGAALPNWLFNVANRLARRIRTAALRRQAHEVALVEPSLSQPEPAREVGDLGPILYEEIGRLPDKYRIPLVLCYLEGKTNEQAAQQLGCPPGTVFSRLARARERLRLRLTRRGLAVSGALLAATLLSLSEQASAAVPQLLEATTVQGALGFGSGKLGSASHMSARVVNLATWGARSWTGRGLPIASSLLLLLGLGGVLSVLFLRPRTVEELIHNRLQGTWGVAAMNVGGMQIASQEKLTFKDDQMTFVGASGTYQIDAGKHPMHLDWTVEGRVSRWIFELQDEKLTLAAGPDRPADFSPQPGKNVTTFKRSGQ